ncbi:3-keto-disaccharide hydrolase [Planctopirus hydrillae]|uniref:3-keto-disaccharide hydrolase n=1 Tax=Planctopirus hydrillae TaxID=1841610 RepID=UPI0009F5ED42|nr:DUF1080 domain-containing protein [Planctopirus hydrillae]
MTLSTRNISQTPLLSRLTLALLVSSFTFTQLSFVHILHAEEPAKKPAPVLLFDGQTLDGWKKVGGDATYSIEDGEIVGRVGPGPNTFLRTLATYGDFELKYDVKLDTPGNSGVQFRSHQKDGTGRTFGYQCEIDPSPRQWTGGIYDESRRGWIYPLDKDEQARKAFKIDDWNTFVITARGPHITTSVNGVRCADLIDTADLEGFIALQVHSGKAGQIRWRNIQLTPLGQSAWKPLWNQKDLAGFRAIGGGEWKVADGELVGISSKEESRHGLLITEDAFRDFAVRVEFKAVTGNSGLYFRCVEADPYGVAGFQAEIDPTKDVGGLYETNGRAWIFQPNAEQLKKAFKPGEWNEMTVVAMGERIVIHLNGIKTVDFIDKGGRAAGKIALQLHGGQDMDVRFRKVEIMRLDDIACCTE